MTTTLPFFRWAIFSPERIFFCLLFLFSLPVAAQDYTTTGASTDWNDPAAWTCTGRGCSTNPVPGEEIQNSTVTINHDITYNGTSNITLRNRGILTVQGATFDNQGNLNIRSGGSLIGIDASIIIGPGILNNDGSVTLTNSLMTKNGNVVNNGIIELNSSCITLLSGNFNNNNTLLGVGGLKVLSGNAKNSGTWSTGISYYLADGGTDLPGTPSTQEEVDEVCRCAVSNCDIEYATPFVLVHDGKLSNALFILGRDGYDPAKFYPREIYTIRVDGGVPKALVQIVVADGQFASLQSQLTSIGVQPGDILVDYDADDPGAYVTCYVPIANLLVLDTSPFLVQVLDGRLTPGGSTGAVLSEGVAAMQANIARLGWEVTGAGITIGVLSDSFDNNNGYLSDQIGKDLPGPSNTDYPIPVDVLTDLDGGGTDEGRAMLQLIHDVAPDAQLKFATAFNGKYNFASQYEALRAAGCDIIVDDVQYLDEAMWRDDVVAQAVNAVVEHPTAPAMVFTAAGNFGSKSIQQEFTPAPAPFQNFHDWGGGTTEQALTLDTGFYMISFQWQDNHASLGDPGGAQIDMNIYLGESPDILDFGSNIVNFGKDPMEFMYFFVLNPTTTNIIIERAAGSLITSTSFKYVVFRSGDTFPFVATPALNASTLVGHANAEKNFTVGAVRYDNLYNAQESSSRGGTTTNGVVRQKPDAMGPTGGDTTVPIGPDYDGDGRPNFFGSSASAPHVGAVAAMVMEAGTKFGVDLSGSTNPALTVRNLLLTTAVDMTSGDAAPGFDFASGFGFVRADLALGAIANPVPNLISYNYEQWVEDNPGFVPGDSSFTMTIVGQNFTEESVFFFQGTALTTTFVNSETLTVTIPPFEGNGNGYVFTESKEGATGDGGQSDDLGIFDLPLTNVVLKPNDITRYYGVSISPLENPELFGFSVYLEDPVTGDLTPLPGEQLALFQDETKFQVSYTTTDQLDSPAGLAQSVLLSVDFADPGLLEIYNYDYEGGIRAGLLTIEPATVEISIVYPETLVYGEPFPGIDYVFNWVDPAGNPIPVENSIREEYKTQHINAFRLVNSLVVITNGRFRLVNDGEVNRFRLVNCDATDEEAAINKFRLVNGECEPEIVFEEADGTTNRFRLVNKTFYVSQGVLDESAPAINRFRLVNSGSYDQGWDATTKIIELDPDLFANVNKFRLVNGDRNLTNLFRLVNDNEYDLVEPDGTTNRFRLVNGVEFSAGAAYFNGQLINRFRLVNGESLTFDVATNRFRLVNSDTGGDDPFVGDTENSVALFNSDEGSSDGTDPPIEVYPVNYITGKDVGIQFVGTGKVLNNNVIATSRPVAVLITPAPLEVTPVDLTLPYGTLPAPEDLAVDLDLLATQLQYDDTFESVFEGPAYTLDCEVCDVPGSPHAISFSYTGDSGNYTITSTIGVLTVTPFEGLTVQVDDVTGDYGTPVTPTFSLSLAGDATWTEETGLLPYGETRETIFGDLTFNISQLCNTDIAAAAGFVRVQPEPLTPNYNVSYNPGVLTVNPVALNLQVGDSFIALGDPVPSSFAVMATGLVCSDPDPGGLTFSVFNSSGTEVSGPLSEGTYQVRIDESSYPATGYEYYQITQSPGTLIVNPELGCNDRIKLSDICKTDNGDGTVTVCFTYENNTPFDIFIPYGDRENQFKGKANIVGGDTPPSLFPANTVDQICLITNGDNIQWEVITPGCNNASKSANGSNANPCSTALSAKAGEVDSFTREYADGVPEAYPNPATDYLTLFVGNMKGDVQVTVFDEVGRQLMSRQYPIEEGQAEVYLDISALKEGILTIVTENQGNRSAFRIIKQ